MKTLLVIIDGLGDDAIPALDGKTPFTYAVHENLDKLEQNGAGGEVSICEEDFLPESLGCILRLLGVDQEDFPRNRAYLELLANGRDISEYEMVMRCNLVSVAEDGELLSFNAQGLNPEQMEEAAAIADALCNNIEFLHLSHYRNLLILDKDQEFLDNCKINPPHESMGENINNLLGDVREKSLLIKNFISESSKLLDKFTHNGVHYMLYPWGVSERTTMKTFEKLHGQKGGVVCAAEIVKGISIALSMANPEMLNATGDIDTDICEKASKTLELLQHKEFVLTHFNGADEAAHRHDFQGKAAFITRIDKEFFDAVLPAAPKPLKLFVCGDHVTSSISGKHTKGKVPFVACISGSEDLELPTISNYQDILKYLFEGR